MNEHGIQECSAMSNENELLCHISPYIKTGLYEISPPLSVELRNSADSKRGNPCDSNASVEPDEPPNDKQIDRNAVAKEVLIVCNTDNGGHDQNIQEDEGSMRQSACQLRPARTEERA